MERTLRSRRAYEGRLISLRVDDVELEDGRRSSREIVEHPGAVAILPWDGTRLTLVRQWRHAAQRELLEIPAGTLEPGEEPLATAKRELLEETGLHAETWQVGPTFYTAPGFCTERLTVYLATDLRDVAATSSAADEAIETSRLPLGDALAAIDGGDVIDAKSLVAILWLARTLGH